MRTSEKDALDGPAVVSQVWAIRSRRPRSLSDCAEVSMTRPANALSAASIWPEKSGVSVTAAPALRRLVQTPRALSGIGLKASSSRRPPGCRPATNRATAWRSSCRFWDGCIEYLLYGLVEVTRERDRQREGGCVALRLDRVDRLPRDVHLRRQPLLGEAARGAQSSDLVLHLL